MRSILHLAALLYFSTASFAATAVFEKLECEGGNESVMHTLELIITDGTVTSFAYSGLTKSAGGDTYYTCTFESKRSASDAEWKDSVSETEIKFKDSASEEDRALITKIKNGYRLYFEMSPSNCGHSSVVADSISITKGKKSCHSISVP